MGKVTKKKTLGLSFLPLLHQVLLFINKDRMKKNVRKRTEVGNARKIDERQRLTKLKIITLNEIPLGAHNLHGYSELTRKTCSAVYLAHVYVFSLSNRRCVYSVTYSSSLICNQRDSDAVWPCGCFATLPYLRCSFPLFRVEGKWWIGRLYVGTSISTTIQMFSFRHKQHRTGFSSLKEHLQA